MRPLAVEAFEAAAVFADPYDVPELPVRFNRLLARVRRRVGELSPAAFALLAWQTWHRLPGNVPAATGASRPVILGQVTFV